MSKDNSVASDIDAFFKSDNKKKKTEPKREKRVLTRISTEVSTSQSASQSTDLSTNIQTDTRDYDMSDVLRRPVAFYITTQQLSNLEGLVKRLSLALQIDKKTNMNQSEVVRLILEYVDMGSDELVTELVKLYKQKLIAKFNL